MLTYDNVLGMLMNVNKSYMTTPLNSAAVGALVRETREAAGLTQTQLAERIGASRFWVAAFEKGKPGAELGLALKAIQALGLAITVAPISPTAKDASGKHSAQPNQPKTHPLESHIRLGGIVARATLSAVAPSTVEGWPTTTPQQAPPQTATRRQKR